MDHTIPNSINYNKMKYFNLTKLNLKYFNRIKHLFSSLQLPFLNNKKIIDIKYSNKNFKVIYD